MLKKWYKEGVVYQIYPQSFKDTNGDGIGDIPGIISKLEYIRNLGATIIWISPIYASPLDDNGYDISDYYDINPRYGTLSDFKELLAKAHDLGLKIVMDLVINHTSDEHPWFIEAKNNPESPYRDFYFFRKGVNGQLPNNWTSFFGGVAWENVSGTDDYYLHLFSKKQPDLNWDNESVRAEIKKMLRFWLDMGVDGFRCDVINLISKREGLPDGRKQMFLQGVEHYSNGPRIHEYLSELRDDVYHNYDMFTVGECAMPPLDALAFIGEPDPELNMIISFDHMGCDSYKVKWFIKKFKPINLKKPLAKWQQDLDGKAWNCLYFENHDQPRSVSRFGSEENREVSAKMLATYLFLQQGTPFIYQGQEIGMTNAHFDDLADYQDVETQNVYRLGRKQFHFSHRSMMRKIKYMSRDNARTPMQWENSANGGFTTGTPWLKVNENYGLINVKNDLNAEDSIYHYYQKLLAFRKDHEVAIYGKFVEHYPTSNKIACYERLLDNEKMLVIVNFTKHVQRFVPPIDLIGYELVLDNYAHSDDNSKLQPYQAQVYYKKEKKHAN